MKQIKVKLHWKQLEQIKKLLTFEESRVMRRANILNCLHHGYGPKEIATILNVSRNTVTNVAQCFLESGLESALYDDERSGRPIDLDDRDRSRIIAMVCTNPPNGHYRWTLDLIVEEVKERGIIEKDVSKEWVRVLLQEHDLKPWLEKMWCIPKLDQEYISRMENVLDTYALPIDENRPVVCIDEKPVALFADARARQEIEKPGDTRKIDYEYKRNGSVNVFCGIEPKKGIYFNKVTPNRCAGEFADFLKDIADYYPNASKITLVMDNLSTHKKKSLEARFSKEEVDQLWDWFNIVYTPKHASWLNQAEIASECTPVSVLEMEESKEGAAY